MEFQSSAFGLSRYRLLDIFFEEFLGRPPACGEKDRLLSEFSEKCRAGYRGCAFTDGALYALDVMKAAGLPMFVVSGSDESELVEVLAARSVLGYFEGVYGSPTTKAENIGKVLALLAGRDLSPVFVGDARADFEASTASGCEFIYMGTWSADDAGMQKLRQAHGFREISRLPDLLPAIEHLP